MGKFNKDGNKNQQGWKQKSKSQIGPQNASRKVEQPHKSIKEAKGNVQHTMAGAGSSKDSNPRVQKCSKGATSEKQSG